MTRLERALIRVDSDLRRIGCRYALVGGLAVSVRAEPRTTRDIDLALAVQSDRDAEEAVRRLLDRGYRVDKQLEQSRTGRLATVRMLAPEGGKHGPVVDLLFASSGIEEEVVEAADVVEILPGVSMRVACATHLLALKLLAGRPHDLADARALAMALDAADLSLTRELLDLISRRGFDRGRNLQTALDRLLQEIAEERGGG